MGSLFIFQFSPIVFFLLFILLYILNIYNVNIIHREFVLVHGVTNFFFSPFPSFLFNLSSSLLAKVSIVSCFFSLAPSFLSPCPFSCSHSHLSIFFSFLNICYTLWPLIYTDFHCGYTSLHPHQQ